MHLFWIFLGIHSLLLAPALFWPNIGLIVFARFVAGILVALYFYAYQAPARGLFVLPASYAPLPFIFIPLLMTSGLGNWFSLLALSQIIGFTIIFLVTTLLASIVMHARKAKLSRDGLPLYNSPKTPGRIMIFGFIAFIAPVILINIYILVMYSQ